MEPKKMIPKRLLSSAISLVVAVALLCVSMIAFLGMNQTTAWFSMNNKVTADGFSVMVSDPQEIHVTLTSYAVSTISNGTYTLFEDQLYTLPVADKQNILYSDYQKALAVVIEVSSKKDQVITIDLTTPNSDFSTYSYTTSPNVISNCMQITYGTFGTASDGKSTVSIGDNTAQSFVTVSNDTLSKVGRLSLLPPNQTSISITGNAAPIKLCYIIEYNEDYTDYIFQKVTNALTMRFDHDITFNVSSVTSN